MKARLFPFLFTFLLPFIAHAQRSFMGVDYVFAKAYKLNAGYEPPTVHNGVCLRPWQVEQFAYVFSQPDVFSPATKLNCGLNELLIFYDKNQREVCRLSFGRECGKANIMKVGEKYIHKRQMTPAAMETLVVLLDEIFEPLVAVVPEKVVAATHEITQKDTWTGIARKYKTSAELVCVLNGKKVWSKPVVGSTIKVYKDCPYLLYPSCLSEAPNIAKSRSHKVKARETLYGIAVMYDVEVQDIKKANQLTTDEIAIGKVLVIPDVE